MNQDQSTQGARTCSVKFTTDDLDAVWKYHAEYLVDILNGDMKLEDARDDLRGLIGSKWDPRISLKMEK